MGSLIRLMIPGTIKSCVGYAKNIKLQRYQIPLSIPLAIRRITKNIFDSVLPKMIILWISLAKKCVATFHNLPYDMVHIRNNLVLSLFIALVKNPILQIN